jgi:hypothetical protein
MSANITHFPLIEEYLRVYPIAVDGKIDSASIYPVKQFRAITTDFLVVIKQSIIESNKALNAGDMTSAVHSLNHHVNTGIAKLLSEGRVVSAEKFQHVVTNMMNELFDDRGIVTTCDGYTVFNPGHIPPTPSSYYN